jgi:nitrite reductase/ring-hydroxylating ferredoxin subunit
MGACDVCGSNEGRMFTVTMGTQRGIFDSFEDAIQMMAPACEHCGCRMLGPPIDSESGIYCSLHCAREAGNPHKPAKAEHSSLAVPAQNT